MCIIHQTRQYLEINDIMINFEFGNEATAITAVCN